MQCIRSLFFLMSTLTIALPFAIPPADYLAALARDSAPNSDWAILKKMARGARFSPSLPSIFENDIQKEMAYEHWLAQELSLPHLPLAPLLLAGEDIDVPAQTSTQTKGWVALQLAHIHATRDHLVLSSPSQLSLSEADAQKLFTAASEPLNELSTQLIQANPMRWYASDENLGQLQTHSPLCAVGRNIDIWMPKGERARFWRKLQNEIQMIWHDHPVNQERSHNNLLPINSIWLFGQGKMPSITMQYDALYANDPLLRGIANVAQKKYMPLSIQTLTHHLQLQSSPLVWLDQLSEAYLNQQWDKWLAIFTQLENDYLHPYYADFQKGRWQTLKLVLFSEQGWLTICQHRKDRWKWWRRQSLIPHLLRLTHAQNDSDTETSAQ